MKTFSKYINITFLLLLIFNSCETIVDVDLPEIKPQIVVNGICNPAIPWELNISSSKDILDDKNIEAIKDAKIEILENGTPVGIFQHIQDGTYKVLGKKPKPNVTYHLKVSAKGFETVTSTCVIPQQVPISSVTVDTVNSTDPEEFEISKINVTLTFSDPPNEDNYYSIIVLQSSVHDTLNVNPIWFYSNDLIIDVKETNLLGDENQRFSGSEAFFNDELINGKEYNLNLNFSFFNYDNSQEFTIVLNTLNYDYYKYLETLKAQRKTNDNPFAEPVIVYNNIKNGLGIFAGYSTSKFKIE